MPPKALLMLNGGFLELSYSLTSLENNLSLAAPAKPFRRQSAYAFYGIAYLAPT